MKISELKEKCPEAEIYELSPDAKYLILVNISNTPIATRFKFRQILTEMNLDAAILEVVDVAETIRILEVEP